MQIRIKYDIISSFGWKSTNEHKPFIWQTMRFVCLTSSFSYLQLPSKYIIFFPFISYVVGTDDWMMLYLFTRCTMASIKIWCRPIHQVWRALYTYTVQVYRKPTQFTNRNMSHVIGIGYWLTRFADWISNVLCTSRSLVTCYEIVKNKIRIPFETAQWYEYILIRQCVQRAFTFRMQKSSFVVWHRKTSVMNFAPLVIFLL